MTKAASDTNKHLHPTAAGAAADAAHCHNCGAELHGKFCHQCGQSSNSIIKFFGEVLLEFIDDVAGWDSRLKHTIVPLLFKPGQITKDYITGKRFYYVLPLRLYLITSVLFILVMSSITDSVKIGQDANQAISASQSIEENQQAIIALRQTREQLIATGANTQSIDAKIADLEKALLESVQPNSVAKGTANAQDDVPETQDSESKQTSVPIQQNQAGDNSDSLSVSIDLDSDDDQAGADQLAEGKEREPGYFEFNKTGDTLDLRGQAFKDYPWLKDALLDINKKSESWKNDPSPLINKIYELLPYMMFVILPIFALFAKVTYLFSKRYYIEHLIFSMHNHCFLYSALLIEVGLEYLADYLAPIENSAAQLAHSITYIASILLLVWIFIYIFIAAKRVYNQGWPITILKTIWLGLIYFIFLVIGLVATVVIGAWQA